MNEQNEEDILIWRISSFLKWLETTTTSRKVMAYIYESFVSDDEKSLKIEAMLKPNSLYSESINNNQFSVSIYKIANYGIIKKSHRKNIYEPTKIFMYLLKIYNEELKNILYEMNKNELKIDEELVKKIIKNNKKT